VDAVVVSTPVPGRSVVGLRGNSRRNGEFVELSVTGLGQA
jgi:hypothetical protein